MQQSKQVGIDPFNKNVIERVISELKDTFKELGMSGSLGGINDFGSGLGGDGLSEMGFNNDVNGSGNQFGTMNEESIDKWLKEF
jgi:hypothetical protein